MKAKDFASQFGSNFKWFNYPTSRTGFHLSPLKCALKLAPLFHRFLCFPQTFNLPNLLGTSCDFFIHKRSETNDPNLYSTVSLTPVISKVFKAVISDKLLANDYWETANVVSNFAIQPAIDWSSSHTPGHLHSTSIGKKTPGLARHGWAYRSNLTWRSSAELPTFRFPRPSCFGQQIFSPGNLSPSELMGSCYSHFL